MRNKPTKRALLASALAVMLCVTMLVGTTLAWFTDDVTAGRNTIQSGNLDVVLEYWDGNSYEEVTPTTPLFNDAALWEPGYTEVAYLKVRNAGSLALKYQLSAVVFEEILGKTKAGTDIKLSDYLVFKVVESDADLADTYTRETAKAAAGTVMGLNGYNGETKELEKKGDCDYLALIIYMPETVGNEANHNGTEIPSLKLGINLLATQFTYEGDSFDNQYDKDAWMSGMAVYTEDDLQSAVNAGENIVLSNDIDLTKTLVIPAGVTVNLDLNGKTITGTEGRDADNNRIHVIVNNGILTIKDGTVTSAGENGGSAIYNAAGATLTVENVTLNGAPQEGSTWPSYTVNNYGTLTVSDSSIHGVQGIIATNNTANTTVNNVIAYRDGWSSGHVFYTSSTAKVTINGGTYTNDGNGVDGTMIYGGETVVNGGTFIVKEGAYFALCSGSKLTVNGGDFSNIKSCIAWGGAMTISGGTFGFNPTTYVADGYIATKNADGTYTVVKGATVDDAAEFTEAIKNGGNIVLTQDIALTETLFANKDDVVLDLNGKTITAPANGNMFHSGSDNEPSILITSSIAGAEINISGGDTAVLLGYGSTEIKNVTINVTGCDNFSPNPFKVYGDLTLGEGTVVNVDYLGTSLISNSGKANIVIDGAKINVGTFRTNAGAVIDLTKSTTLALKNTDVKVGLDTTYTSYFIKNIKKADDVTIEDCTFDIKNLEGTKAYDIVFKPDASVGDKYVWVQK